MFRGLRVSNRFKQLPFDSASRSDEETVAALVAMLAGMGIDRSRIEAMIDKTTRPGKILRALPGAGNANESAPSPIARRSA